MIIKATPLRSKTLTTLLKSVLTYINLIGHLERRIQEMYSEMN
jgi:hypothetical protein